MALMGRMAGIAMVLAGAATWQTAHAQTSLVLPGTYSSSGAGLVSTTVGGWTISIYSCAQKNESFSIAAADCSTSKAVITATAGGLSVVFQNVTNGQPLLTSSYGLALSDLNFNMTVTTPSGQTVTSASVTMAGSVTTGFSSDLVDLTTGITLVANSTTYTGLNTNLSNSSVLASQGIAPANSVSLQAQDIKIATTPAHPGDTTMAINTVTDTFHVPEPISLSLFTVGLAGLGMVRQRRAAQRRNDRPS